MGATAVRATVASTLPNSRFLCRLDDGTEIVCHVAGNARMELVRVLPGERVAVEPSPVDPSKGRIVGKDAGRVPTEHGQEDGAEQDDLDSREHRGRGGS